MKILLRKYDEEYYTWKDAVFENGNFYVDGCRIYNTNIIQIKDDYRKDYVQCAYCGAVIKNTPEDIEAHFAAQEAERNCFRCSSLRKYSVNHVKADIVEDATGKMTIQETYEADLRCGQSWNNSPKITSDAVKKVCIYYRCRNAGTVKIEDIFTQYPDLFDKHITVDTLNEKGFTYEGYNAGFFEYDMKCRNTLKACVNELGIVDHFVIKHRGYRFNAFYSAKYDLLVFLDGERQYSTRTPYAMSDTKYTQAKTKITAMYKEEK